MRLTSYILNPARSAAITAYNTAGRMASRSVQAGSRVVPYSLGIGLTLATLAVIGYNLARPLPVNAENPPTPTPTAQPAQTRMPVYDDIEQIANEILEDVEGSGPNQNIVNHINDTLDGEGSTAFYEGLHDTVHGILEERERSAYRIADQRAAALAEVIKEAECWKAIVAATESVQKSSQGLEGAYKAKSDTLRTLPESALSSKERARALAETDANYAEEKNMLNLKAVVMPGQACIEAKEDPRHSTDAVRSQLRAKIDQGIYAAHKDLHEILEIPQEMRSKPLSPEYVQPEVTPTPQVVEKEEVVEKGGIPTWVWIVSGGAAIALSLTALYSPYKRYKRRQNPS